MRKNQGVLDHEVRHSRRSRVPMVILFLLVLIVSPLAYECGSLVFARWQSIYGTYWAPRTPLLSAIAEWSAFSNFETRRQFSSRFLNGHWSPNLAIPLAVTWAGLAAFFLRRGD